MIELKVGFRYHRFMGWILLVLSILSGVLFFWIWRDALSFLDGQARLVKSHDAVEFKPVYVQKLFWAYGCSLLVIFILYLWVWF